jgi:hypothetical protein
MSEKKFWCIMVPVIVVVLILFAGSLSHGSKVENLEKVETNK